MLNLPGEGGASWLPDPAGRFEQRYWDGSRWTTAVMRGDQVFSDPEEPPSGGAASPIVPPPVPPVPSQAAMASVPAVGPADRYTSLRPDEAQRRLGQLLSMQGWTVRAASYDRLDLTLSVPGEANMLLGLLLILLWILPGLIYFALKRRPTQLNAMLTFVPTEQGTRIAVSGGSVAIERLAPVMLMLPW
jgi:hypothetical protein